MDERVTLRIMRSEAVRAAAVEVSRELRAFQLLRERLKASMGEGKKADMSGGD